jgi:ABC-type sugar transport system permease subunit
MTTTTAPAARANRRARSGTGSRQLTGGDKATLAVMVAVPTLIQLLLVWLPMVLSIVLSFMKWNALKLSDVKPVGMSNYAFVVQDYPPFWPAVAHNVIWLLFLACVATPIGLLLAVLLDQQIKGTRIYQSVFFVPVMLSLPLVGIIWQLMYARNEGFINNVLGTANTAGAIDWFGDSQINLWAALIAATWRHAGYIMVLYLAGLKGVDPSLREAAAVDGASPVQTFFRVVFPAMKPINIVVVVITVIEALRAFDIVYIINRGTNGLELIGALVVQNLVGEGQVIGIGSALAVMLLLVALVPITIYLTRTFGAED